MVSRNEIERRYEALREVMRDAGYDALVIAGGSDYSMRGYVRYVADWRLFGGTGFAVFPLDDEPAFLLGLGAQAEWAKADSAIKDTRAVLDKMEGMIAVLREKGLSKGSIGVVGLNDIMPYGNGLTMMTLLPGARFGDATRLMQDVMVSLSEEEKALVEETHGYLVRIKDRIKEAMAPGKTEREVLAAGLHEAARLGCLDGMAHLTNRAASGTRPGSERRITEDDIIKVFLEFSGPSGFLIELGAVFSFREPPDLPRRKNDTVIKAINRSAELMRPGVKAGELCEVIRETFVEDGWNITGRRLWDFHGQGLNSMMPPVGMPGSEEVLKENMMLNIHPGILTEDGWGVSVTHNYFVTADGGKALGNFKPEWHVLTA